MSDFDHDGPKFIGIDPGASGAAVILDYKGDAGDVLKFKDATERDIADWLNGCGTEVRAFIEAVNAMPKQGVSSTFKFGKSYGFLRGCLSALGIPFEDIRPQKWQAAMGCLSKGNKNVTKAAAQRLWPQLKITHANADALLIAEYGRRTWNMREGNT